jgi:hypothetical protein
MFMNKFLRAEIDGEAAACAALITELREANYPLLLDGEGFLLVPVEEWDELERIANGYGCELYNLEMARRAA